jgi:hypothetical protein
MGQSPYAIELPLNEKALVDTLEFDALALRRDH